MLFIIYFRIFIFESFFFRIIRFDRNSHHLIDFRRYVNQFENIYKINQKKINRFLLLLFFLTNNLWFTVFNFWCPNKKNKQWSINYDLFNVKVIMSFCSLLFDHFCDCCFHKHDDDDNDNHLVKRLQNFALRPNSIDLSDICQCQILKWKCRNRKKNKRNHKLINNIQEKRNEWIFFSFFLNQNKQKYFTFWSFTIRILELNSEKQKTKIMRETAE